MQLRWTHDGVLFRAPVRFARRLRFAATAALLVAGVLTLWLLHRANGPQPGPDWTVCASDPSAPHCVAARPPWKTWDYTRERWRAARLCALLGPRPPERADSQDHLFARRVDPERGLDAAANIEFLSMVARQDAACDPGERFASLRGARLEVSPDALPYNPGLLSHRPGVLLEAAIAHADLEYDVLAALEGRVLGQRWNRARGAEVAREAAGRHVADRLQAWAWAWVPALLLGWVALLVGTRRMLRGARPLELRVGPDGVRLDGRLIPRESVAWIALDGARLRIERWGLPPVLSRALPADALASADEIASAIGALDPVPGPRTAPVPDALRRVVRQRQTP